METTHLNAEPAKQLARERLEDELATLSAHINAATARWLELVSEFEREGGAGGDDLGRWLAFRCGLSAREAREFVRVAEALADLPAIRESFARGQLSFSKVRALTRVATPSSEQALLELAEALTASQLERALRVFRRVTLEEVRETQALEYVAYHWEEDGSLVLRARLAAEEGTIVVRALEAARDRLRVRRREEQEAAASTDRRPRDELPPFEPRRDPDVEALLELAQTGLASASERALETPRLVVHVDAAALTSDRPGRSELEAGPVIAPETARRLGCDAERVSVLERDGLTLSVGRTRRTVPPRLRRLLEARDDGRCQWPGCDRRRYLAAHHRQHWAQGGETSLDNLVLLCWQHHRLVHEGGYTIEEAAEGELRFRNRHGVVVPSVPRSPPGSVDELVLEHERSGLEIDAHANRIGYGGRLDLEYAFGALEAAVGYG